MNTIQNQNLSFASKFPLINRGVPVERFKELARRYDMNEYLNILGQHYDVKGVVTQSPHFRNNVTLELSCLDESKKKTKWGRFVENIFGLRKVFKKSFVTDFSDTGCFLDSSFYTPLSSSNWIGDKVLQYSIHATDPSRSFRMHIVKALKERASNSKCAPEQKARAGQVCDMIEDWAERSKNKLRNDKLEELQKYYGDNVRIELKMDFHEPQAVGFSTDI